ncbi:hypothetical protein U1Q18_011793 [Sarracenia purpurea var. burkii]
MSASEIEYPISTTHGDQQANINNNGNSQKLETDVEVDVSVEIMEDFQTYQTRKEEIPEKEETEEDVSIEILDEECAGGASEIHVRKQSATPNAKVRALQRARDFKSENPFFMTSLQPSHVYRNHGSATLVSYQSKFFWIFADLQSCYLDQLHDLCTCNMMLKSPNWNSINSVLAKFYSTEMINLHSIIAEHTEGSCTEISLEGECHPTGFRGENMVGEVILCKEG